MEKSSMAILLQNLLARAPRLNDLSDVTRLLIACDIIEDGMSDYTEEELLADWQRPGFNLDTDAWVIITNKGQLVGFAYVWSCDYTQIKQLTALAQPQQRTGIYIARQYDIYEKELRAGEVLPTTLELPIQSVYS